MKRKNTLWSLVLALVMVLGVIAPLGALADTLAPKVDEGDISTTMPTQTKLIVHKLQADSYKIGATSHNGGKLDPATEFAKIGDNVSELDGVTFTYYKLKNAAQLKKFVDTPASYTTKAQVEAEGLTAAGTITTAGGAGANVSLGEGFYWFIETGKPPEVSSSIAVPFGISLPLMNKEKVGTHEANTVYLTTVHTYPKNTTGTEPEPKKTVGNEVNMNETHNVGDIQTWYLQATVPGNIKDYETFKMTDVFFKGLTYKGNVSVYFGYENGDADKVALTAGTDYTLTQPAVDKKFTTEIPANLKDPITAPSGEEFEVKLTAAGIAKLAENYQALKAKAKAKGKDVKLYATVDTVINEDAKMGTAIPNTFDLTYKIKEQDEKHKKPGDEPKVKTGGKKFIKVAESNHATTLAGAVFELYDGTTQIKWTDALIKANATAIAAGKFAADKNGTATTAPTAGQPIYLMSDGSGLFEIKGLEYTNWKKTERDGTTKDITHDYKIKEVKAPKDYGFIKDSIGFTVDDKSYKDDATGYPENTHDAKGNMLVENRDLTIPQTGGIGTMIFMVAGLALMGGAFIAMRKRSAEQA